MMQFGFLKYVFSPILLLCCISLSCTTPSEPQEIQTHLILGYLLDIPPIPFPPETEQNVSNPGFIATTGYCQDIVELRLPFEEWVQILSDENIQAVRTGNKHPSFHSAPEMIEEEVKWVRTHSDNVSTVTLFVWLNDLNVTPDDLFSFLMIWAGPEYESQEPDSSYGYVEPSLNRGIVRGVDWRVQWEPGLEGLNFGGLSRYWTAALFDSTSGGGRLVRQVGLGLDTFRAYWDAHGHGSYQSADLSGDW